MTPNAARPHPFMIERTSVAGMALWLALTCPGGVAGQAAASPPATLRLSATWDVTRHQPRSEPLRFDLSRTLNPEDGRLAVIVGRTDLSALLEIDGMQLRLPLQGERIPTEDQEIVTYLVSPAGEWRETGRFVLRRLTRAGFDSAALRPKLDLQTDGQLRAQLPPDAPPGVRSGAYHDLTLSGGFEAGLGRNGKELGLQGLLVGASRSDARLRASQLGSSAPAVDLAAYNLRLTMHPFALALGHIGLGNQRHLVNQFRSRGTSAEAQLGKRVRATLAGVAGSEIVGWDDPVGLRRPTHRIVTGTLGIEAAPSRPGTMRLDLTRIQGSLQPTASFNQGAITDRQESDGVGAQLAAALPSGRVRLLAGIARSRFSNPADPLLSGDSAMVAVQPETRSARFGELTIDVVRSARLGPVTTRLALAARHERIDPQYRSVAVSLQANRDQNSIEASGSIDALQVQLSVARSRDNLDEIPSLLTTRSQSRSLNLALPLMQLMRAEPSDWWWPSLTFAWQGVSQIGDETPVNGGFRFVFQVPDQQTSNFTLSADWQHSAWNLSWRHNHSLVDNRQPERERSDFATDAHSLTFGFTPSPRLTLGIDFAREAQRDIERAQRMRNDRMSLQLDWRPVGHTALSAAGSLVTIDNPGATMRGRDTELRVEASQGFNVYARAQGASQARAFLRYTRAGSALRTAGDIQPATRRWTLNSGLSLRVF